jgi:glycosyltransferase involved in cell wall biosynthesis
MDHMFYALSERLSQAGGKMVFFSYEGSVTPQGLSMIKQCNGELWTSNGTGLPGSPVRGVFGMTVTAIKICREISPHLIVGQYTRPSHVAVLTGKVLGIPTIRVARASPSQLAPDDTGYPGPARRRVHGLLGNLATVTVAISEATKQYEISCGVRPEKIRVMYDRVNPQAFLVTRPRSDVRREIGVPDDAKILLIAASLIPLKGHMYLLEAFKKIGSDGPHLVVAGEGPSLQRLQRFALESNLTNRVHFVGQRTDMPNLLNAFDCVVLPSISEAFGMILLEAMFMGLPVIASNVGGIGEIVKDNETGILVRPGSVDDLHFAITDFMRDPEKWRKMGAAGKDFYSEQPSFAQRLQEEIELYQTAASRVGWEPVRAGSQRTTKANSENELHSRKKPDTPQV